jgi:outer membrane lipoprotein-sorting protein
LTKAKASSLRRMIAFRVAPMLVGGTLLAACAVTGPPEVPPPVETAPPEFSKVQEPTQTLVERARRFDAMQAEAVMGYDGGGQRLKIREEIAIKRPASMRVEALTPFGVGAVVVANGQRLAIYEPSENTFYRGASTADTLSRFARIPLPPTEAIKLLMGLLPDDGADFNSPNSVRTEGDLVIGTYRVPGGTVDELGFANGQLRMVRVGGKSGRPAYEVHYDDYRDIGGLQFAHKLEASFLNTGTHLNVRYSAVIVNPTLDDSEFVLVPQDKAKVIDLDVPALMGGNG